MLVQPAATAGGITHSDQQQRRCSSKLADYELLAIIEFGPDKRHRAARSGRREGVGAHQAVRVCDAV